MKILATNRYLLDVDKVSPPLDELGIPEEPEGDEEDKEEEDRGLVEGHPPELRDPLPNGAAHLVVLPREGAAELPGHPRGALAPVEEPNLQCMTDFDKVPKSLRACLIGRSIWCANAVSDLVPNSESG